jgi:energy-coupling factor transporter ATP-binding protein EcfA2
MRLQSFKVENYKSIYDSGSIQVNSVICLVGKNESGKTALLESLYKLNPVDSADGDFTPVMEYPRTKWLDYLARPKAEEAKVLYTEWLLDEEDKEFFESEFGPGALASNSVTLTKGYSNVIDGFVAVNESNIVNYLLASSELSEHEKQPLNNCVNLADLINEMSAELAPAPSYQQFLGQLKSRFPDAQVQPYALHVLSQRIPTMLYLPSYAQLPGQVSIEDLFARQEAMQLEPSDEVFFLLLDLAGIKPQELAAVDQFEDVSARLEAASAILGETVFKYWSQNPRVDVDFRFDPARAGDAPPFNKGTVARLRIRDQILGVSVGFDERSTGFVWFFSFLVWLSQLNKVFGDNIIILLDEPATNLHARAQADLLKYIYAELEPRFQIIYSTHSPFMIDLTHFEGVRSVENIVSPGGDNAGTTVVLPGKAKNPDTIAPVQAALGYQIVRNYRGYPAVSLTMEEMVSRLESLIADLDPFPAKRRRRKQSQ